jgi:hypothetical protein
LKKFQFEKQFGKWIGSGRDISSNCLVYLSKGVGREVFLKDYSARLSPDESRYVPIFFQIPPKHKTGFKTGFKITMRIGLLSFAQMVSRKASLLK